jgi:molybdopterin synthase catalytic subunit
MLINVRYFAVVRERLGLESDTLELPAGASVADALVALSARHAPIAALRGHLAVAVNQEMVPPATPLAEGDELALIPPVAGGAGPFRVVDRPIALDEVVDAVSSEVAGAIVTFTGTVRRRSRGLEVDRLEYEAYGEMAERVLARIGGEVEAAFADARVAIVHRVGTVRPGEVSVVIAVATPHRADAFEGCRRIIERLKTDVPIWKKELAADGTALWVGLGS